MGRVQEEAIKLIGVGFRDIFIRSQTVESFETPGIVVGIDESGEMALKLLVMIPSTPHRLTKDSSLFTMLVALDVAGGHDFSGQGVLEESADLQVWQKFGFTMSNLSLIKAKSEIKLAKQDSY
jgi:hypothetical protein